MTSRGVTLEELREWLKTLTITEESCIGIYFHKPIWGVNSIELSYNRKRGQYSLYTTWVASCHDNKEVVDWLESMGFSENAKHEFEKPTYVNYVEWYAYAVERISDPISKFKVIEIKKNYRHMARVSYFAEDHDFTIRENKRVYFYDAAEIPRLISCMVPLYAMDCKKIVIKEMA